MKIVLIAIQYILAVASASVCGLQPGECGGAVPPLVAPHHQHQQHGTAHRRRRHHKDSSSSSRCCGGCPYQRGPQRAKLLGQLYLDALTAGNEIQIQSLQIPNMPSVEYDLCLTSTQCCKSPNPFSPLLSTLFSPPFRPYQLTAVEVVEGLVDHSVVVQATMLFYGEASLVARAWQVQMKWSWMADCEMRLSEVVGVDVPCIGKAGFGSEALLPVTSVCSEGCIQTHIYTTTITTTSTSISTTTITETGTVKAAGGRVAGNRMTQPTGESCGA